MSKKRIYGIVIAVSFAIVALLTGCTSGGGSGVSASGGTPDSLDVVFAANEFARTLSVTDLQTGRLQKSTQGLGDLSNDMLVRPNTNELWVLHSDPAQILRYRIQSTKINPPVYFSDVSLLSDGENPNPHPYNFAFTPTGNYYYYSNLYANTVSMRNASDESQDLISTLWVGYYPQGVTVLPNGRVVVTITNMISTSQYGTGEVVMCDSALTDTIRRTTVGLNPQVTRYYNNILYVLCTGDYASTTGSLWRLDPATLQPLSLPLGINAYPGDLAIDVDSTGAVWGIMPARPYGTSSDQSIQIARLDAWILYAPIAVTGGPSRVITLPQGGVAISLQDANKILIRMRTGITYELYTDSGPKALVAMPK